MVLLLSEANISSPFESVDFQPQAVFAFILLSSSDSFTTKTITVVCV
jgi:hypothetical protein